MNRFRNEKGMTLTELLAALALAGVVVVIIMTTFSIGAKHHSLETRNLNSQQTMNLVITQLIQKHRTGDCYFLEGTANGIRWVEYIRSQSNEDQDGKCTITQKSSPPDLLGEGVEFSVCRVSVNSDGDRVCNSLDPSQPTDPLREDLRLKITLIGEKGKEFVQETTLSRFKEGDLE